MEKDPDEELAERLERGDYEVRARLDLQAIRSLRQSHEALESAVHKARASGSSWTAIGTAIGVPVKKLEAFFS